MTNESFSSYHSYCVGLQEIPIGRWQCVECSHCMSCKSRDAAGTTSEVDTSTGYNWVFEYKIGNNGTKIYSHTLCVPCHKFVAFFF